MQNTVQNKNALTLVILHMYMHYKVKATSLCCLSEFCEKVPVEQCREGECFFSFFQFSAKAFQETEMTSMCY